MRYKSYDHMNCSLAQTLDVIGERWSLLILRDAFFWQTSLWSVLAQPGHLQEHSDRAAG